MTEYKPGQRVKVEFDATVKGNHFANGSLYVKRDDGIINAISTRSVKITVLDPPDWPPQVGDIWEADGVEYYIRTYRGSLFTGTPRVVVDKFDSHDRGTMYPPNKLDDFKALNPVLVRRRGQ